MCKDFVVPLAVVEGRGNARGEIGLASMDALCSELSLSQFIDTASYTRLRIQLQVLDPVEVGLLHLSTWSLLAQVMEALGIPKSATVFLIRSLLFFLGSFCIHPPPYHC